MKINKLLAGLLTLGVTFTIANGMENGCKAKMDGACKSHKSSCGNKDESKGCSGKNSCKDKMQGCSSEKCGLKGGDSVKLFLHNIDKISLSISQKNEIKTILESNKPTNNSLSEAFSKHQFDSQKFIEMENEAKENKITHQAMIIEKIYNTLNNEQKSRLKELLDNEKEVKDNIKHHNKRGYEH